MCDDSNLVLSPTLLFQESEVYRNQKILFVLIDILFTFNLVMLIAFLHYYDINPSIDEVLRFYYPLIWIVLSIIYDIFGLLVTYLCYRIGLRVFAWLGTIFIVLDIFAFALVLFLPFHMNTKSFNSNRFDTPRYMIFVIFWIFISVLLIISVRLAFKLSKLMTAIRQKVKEPLSIWQI